MSLVQFRPEAPICGFSSFGRASPCQGEGGGFEPRNPLHFILKDSSDIWTVFCFLYTVWRIMGISPRHVFLRNTADSSLSVPSHSCFLACGYSAAKTPCFGDFASKKQHLVVFSCSRNPSILYKRTSWFLRLVLFYLYSVWRIMGISPRHVFH